ncbi:hypothetical protein Bhyg_07999, partial [Pseudolycoriella hygida]
MSVIGCVDSIGRSETNTKNRSFEETSKHG